MVNYVVGLGFARIGNNGVVFRRGDGADGFAELASEVICRLDLAFRYWMIR